MKSLADEELAPQEAKDSGSCVPLNCSPLGCKTKEKTNDIQGHVVRNHWSGMKNRPFND